MSDSIQQLLHEYELLEQKASIYAKNGEELPPDIKSRMGTIELHVRRVTMHSWAGNPQRHVDAVAAVIGGPV
jgi:hypothetical protein